MYESIRDEFLKIFRLETSSLSWGLSFFTALASGVPFVIGLYFDQITYGILSSMGGLVFLYFPTGGGMRHELAVMLVITLGMCMSYALGFFAQLNPSYSIAILSVVFIIITIASKAYFAGPPGNLIFVMIAFMAAYSPPLDSTQMLINAGFLFFGGFWACILGSCFNALQQSNTEVTNEFSLNGTHIKESIWMGVFIFLALFIANMFHLKPAYWVGVSCLVVMQENSVVLMWRKNIQRIIGTVVGVIISYFFLTLFPFDEWMISFIVFLLAFSISLSIRINYALTCAFITMQVMILIETVNFNHEAIQSMLNARLTDTVVGCFVGLIGGFFMLKFCFPTHSPCIENVK